MAATRSASEQADTAEPRGLIFDIQGHSVHDGPGTRTLVFMSGCPMRCRWCSNPEGQTLRPRLMYRSQFCNKCPLRCVQACPKDAIQPAKNAHPPILLDRGTCDDCSGMECTKVCYMQALQPSGSWYTVDELMRLFNRDQFYWGSDGGITFTGGEPLLQSDFLLKVLNRCREAYISACIETNAYVPRPVLEAVLPLVEWLFIDIKHMDSAKHVEGTGVPNEPVLDNIRGIASTGWPGRVIIRVPVVPGYNDTPENAEATARFLRSLGLSEVNLLPFHRLGASKYEQLGLAYEYADSAAHNLENLEPLASVFRMNGISCYLSADTPF